MARPVKCRRIHGNPEVDYFKPRGVPVAELEEVRLTMDEFEALRLAHLEDLYQEQAAAKMEISRPTFGNILNSAHKKIADCIVRGKALRIEGGIYIRDEKRSFRCNQCCNEWSLPYGTGRPVTCPKCTGCDIQRIPHNKGRTNTGRTAIEDTEE
jgi:predicted DNA-binding protein (UPF0251 family)